MNFPNVRPEWLNQLHEEVIEPELPIVDAHHHLWHKPGWRYLLDEFLSDVNSGHNIVATVFVQCMSMHRRSGPEAMSAIGETEFANGIAAMSESGLYGSTQICSGIVSYADLRLGADAERLLDAHMERGGPRFKGIRQILAWDECSIANKPEYLAEPGMMADPNFRRGFSLLEPRGLSFEAWLFHPQLNELTDLAKAFPSTRIVLNHLGTPLGIGGHAHQRDETKKDWLKNIRELSCCENVVVKLGGLGMRSAGMNYANHPTPMTSDQLALSMRSYMLPCIDFFGPERCMFESNFPVDKASYSYRTCWNAYKKVVNAASASEKGRLFAGTAKEFYRL